MLPGHQAVAFLTRVDVVGDIGGRTCRDRAGQRCSNKARTGAREGTRSPRRRDRAGRVMAGERAVFWKENWEKTGGEGEGGNGR